MMRQLLQSLADGRTLILDVPMPRPARGALSIRTTCSLISAGTERMLVEFGRAGLLQKARQQPERVRQALAKARTDGLYGWPGFGTLNLWRQDKGQRACARAFVEAVSHGGPAPIAIEEIFEVARCVVALAEAVHG